MAVKVRYRKVNNNRYNVYLDIYKEGIRRTETLPGFVVSKDYSKQVRKSFSNKSDEEFVIKAEAKAAEMNTELLTGTPPVRRKAELFHYLNKKMEQCTNTRVFSYQRLKYNLLKFQTTPILLDNITKTWLYDFKAFLMKKQKPTTVDNYLSTLKLLLNEAEEEYYIPSNPFPKRNFLIKSNIDKKTLNDYLTLEEVHKLNKTQFSSDVCKSFLFACFSGLRISDIENLKWQNIKEGSLHIVQKKTRLKVPKENVIPLSSQALQILETINKSGDKVFDLPTSYKISNTLKLWAEIAGVEKDIHFHMARHTFGALFLQSGGSIYSLKELLGHTTVTTTENFYGHLVDTMKRSQIEMMPVL